MKILLSFFLLPFFVLNACSQTGDLSAKVDERTELMGIVFRLSGADEYSNNSVKQYSEDIDNYFRSYANHDVIKYASRLRSENSIAYDAVASLAVNLLIDRENISLLPGIVVDNIDSRWDQKSIKKFIELLNDFYSKSKFHDFFTAHSQFYEKAVKDYNIVLNKIDFNWFEKFYGEKIRGSFISVINFECNGNFGPKVIYADGRQDIYSINGTSGTDNSGIPEYSKYSDQLIPEIVHEYNHSFCNHIILAYYPQMKAKADEFFALVSEKMYQMAYGNSKTYIAEMLVRASVIKYYQDHHADSMKIRMMIKSEQAMGFIWIDKLVALLDDYKKDRQKYPDLSTFIPEIVKLLNSLSPKELFADNNINLPFIISSSIKNNDFSVDPAIRTLVIKFDRRMNINKNGISYGKKGEKYFPDIADAQWNKETENEWIIQLELKPDTEYSLTFPSFFFFDKDTNNLKETYYLDFKTRK